MPLEKSFKAGEKIISEGTFGEETFRITAGQVLICKETGGEKPVVLAELRDGEVFGEMYVFQNSGARSASAVAKTDVVVQVVSRPEIEEHLKATPQVIQDILVSLNKRLEGTSQDFSLVSSKKFQWERVFNKLLVALLLGALIGQILICLKPC